uniref:Uncharacterized protein n=1 Tax=Brassica oleracea TaxID=3712 RepID=A0A3P6F082_BRAOL|nr:unnamed protein product [Brassica oleracea]
MKYSIPLFPDKNIFQLGMLSTVSAIKEQMLCCLLCLSTQKTLIRNRDFLHYNHLLGIVAEILAWHFPGLPPCLWFF